MEYYVVVPKRGTAGIIDQPQILPKAISFHLPIQSAASNRVVRLQVVTRFPHHTRRQLSCCIGWIIHWPEFLFIISTSTDPTDCTLKFLLCKSLIVCPKSPTAKKVCLRAIYTYGSRGLGSRLCAFRLWLWISYG